MTDTVWIKLMAPLPEIFGFKEEVPFCILGEETGENDTIEGLMRRLAAKHPDFAEVAFLPSSGTQDSPTIAVQLNEGPSSLGTSAGAGDMITVSMGRG